MSDENDDKPQPSDPAAPIADPAPAAPAPKRVPKKRKLTMKARRAMSLGGSGGAAQKRTPELYAKIVQAFRDVCVGQGEGMNFGKVALWCGVDARTVKRTWERGFARAMLGKQTPKPYAWAPPIRDVFAKEQQIAREESAAYKRQQQAKLDRAREEAEREVAEALREETELRTRGRKLALAALGILAKSAKMQMDLDARVEKILAGKSDVELETFLKLILTIRRDFGLQVGRLVKAAETMVKLGRLERGQTTENIGIGGEELTDEELKAELSAGAALAKQVEEGLVELGAASGDRGSGRPDGGFDA